MSSPFCESLFQAVLCCKDVGVFSVHFYEIVLVLFSGHADLLK